MKKENAEPRRFRAFSRMAQMLVLAVLLTTLAGCALALIGAGVGAGAAGVAYVQGALIAQLDATPQGVEQATVKAFETLEIPKISSKSSAVDAEIKGRTATDTSVEVTGALEETNTTKVSIRVGFFGDETLSRKILDEIKKNLPRR